jgi:plasmid stabilization system protein ParE
MAYRVRFSARAERDFANLYQQIDAEHSDAALEWYRGFQDAILSLEEHPKRCPKTPEDPRLRHLLYGSLPRVYRVIYRVQERQRRVDVLHIRHGARRSMPTAS